MWLGDVSDSFSSERSPVNLLLSYTLCRLSTMGKKEPNVRMSLQTLRVLEVFLENPTEHLAGAEVHQRCGIASGTLYPILLRLESAGWFVSQWESIDPSVAGRPRRRLYRLTSTGLRRASEVFASFNRGVLA
jgi:PadR family transcriptional regulator PadR